MFNLAHVALLTFQGHSSARTSVDSSPPKAVQEVTSFEQVERLRDDLQLATYHVAISNFAPDDDQEHGSIEVAIMSRFPLENFTENDPNASDMPEEEKSVSVPTNIPGLAPTANTARGFLMARIPSKRLTLWVTYLKSSQHQYTGASLRAFKTEGKTLGTRN